MERPGLLQSVGVALLFTVSAVVGQRRVERDPSSDDSSRNIAVGGTTTAPVVAAHLDGRALLSAYYQREITSLDRRVLRALILTLPDPVSSHLDWSYDAELESVRRAMEHNGYLIDRFWLPWRATADTAAGRLGVADSLPGARWPGVMLFRAKNASDSTLVLIYVVGEVPTSGIHRRAMKEALDERRRLLPADSTHKHTDTLRVIGPAFSGSARSLRRALVDWRGSDSSNAVIEIVSGSASDATNLATLSDSTNRMRFRATVHTSGWLAAAALRLVTQQLRILPSEVAFLHEGTTQFGNSAASDSASARATAAAARDSASALTTNPVPRGARAKADTLRESVPSKVLSTGKSTSAKQSNAGARDTAATPPLEISFPMSISGLRVQYARHPDRAVAEAAGAGAPVPEGPRLALDQREPASLSESPGFLSQLTAPSTELLLGQIERSLSAHHVRAVGILATDVRDELFLADEIRKRLPDVQLFFYGSNILLLRSDYQKALRGSLVVSTYPLVTENQFWDLTRNDRERLIFTSDESEGVFNATLFQLGDSTQTMEYASPMSRGESHGPPTWLTVVGRDAMYPVALAADSAAVGSVAESTYMATRAMKAVKVEPEANAHPGQFMLVLFLMLAAFIASFVLLQRRTSRRVKAAAAFPTDLLTREERQRSLRRASLLLHREMYVLLRQVSLFAAFSGTLLLVLRPQAHGVSTERWLLRALALVAGFLICVVFWRAIVQSVEVLSIAKQHGIRLFSGLHAKKNDKLLSGVELGARFLVFAVGLGYFGLTLVFLGQVIGLDPVSSTLFFQRAVAVTGGVSPAVPLVLAALGFASWCTWHLARISLLAEPTVFEEFLLRQADIEDIRGAAVDVVRSLEHEAGLRAREAHEWTHRAVKARRMLRNESAPPVAASVARTAAAASVAQEVAGASVAQEVAGASVAQAAGDAVVVDRKQPDERASGAAQEWRTNGHVSPEEMLGHAVAAATAAREAFVTAQAELKQARDATPGSAWQSSDSLNDDTQDIRQWADRADWYVARAKPVLQTARIKAREQQRQARTGLQSDVLMLGIRLGTSTSRLGSRTTALVKGSIGRIAPLRVATRTTMRSVGALADWYERASHERVTVRRTPSAARDVSDALFYLIPNGPALAAMVVMIGFALWLASQFQLSLESLVLKPLRVFGNATSFDVLFRFAVLTLTGLTAWAVYRLTVVWTGIRRILDELPPDLVPSFVALPTKLARVTHLTLFGHASASEIKKEVEDHVGKMNRAFAEAKSSLPSDLEKLGSEASDQPPVPRARPYRLQAQAYQRFEHLHKVLDACRDHHLLAPSTSASESAETSRRPQAANGANGNGASHPVGAAASAAWARSVADLYVVFVADYVDWVLQHLRYLASFLLICLLVMVVLLSAYPFQPQSALRVIHTVILVVAVATLVFMIIQMNQQPILSAIANTTPGAVNWNSHFVRTLATYGGLPLVALLSTQFPAVRDFLFAWVAPLIRTFAKG